MSLPADKILEMLYEAYKALNKSDLEKFENEWKKNKQELLDAVNSGDIDTIRRITAIFSGL